MPSETVYFPDGQYRTLKAKVESGEADNFSQAVQDSLSFEGADDE